MSNDFQYDVFLSHSAKDKTVVRPLAERWQVAVRQHLKVWFDEWVRKPTVPLAHRMGEGAGVRAAKIEAGLEHSRSALQPLAFSCRTATATRSATAFAGIGTSSKGASQALGIRAGALGS